MEIEIEHLIKSIVFDTISDLLSKKASITCPACRATIDIGIVEKKDYEIRCLDKGYRNLEESPFDIQDLIGSWGDSTFDQGTPDTITNHFAREAIEFTGSQSPEEAADCVILLLHHAHKRGYNLIEEVLKKFEINKKRKWGSPDEQGVVEHIRESREEEKNK